MWGDLADEKAMVFISGPRQVGKTTLAKIILERFVNRLYFNWDIPADRARLSANPAFFEELERKDNSIPLVVLDEIRKYRDWKNYLKGAYDCFYDTFRFLVTGSGRLDMYQKGGDSLAGRYYLFHLWPFTLGEIGGKNREMDQLWADPLFVDARDGESLKAVWDNLEAFSGFPELFLAAKPDTYRRWSNNYGRNLSERTFAI